MTYRDYAERCVSCGRSNSVQYYGEQCVHCLPRRLGECEAGIEARDRLIAELDKKAQ